MKTPIDTYIAKATRGLPRRERLDTAAELRVHLNRHSEELRLTGFSREEAEHLAVEGMGPVEPVNRKFVGHVFTARSGWLALSLLVLGLGVWGAGVVVARRPAALFTLLTPSPFDGVAASMTGVAITVPAGVKAAKVQMMAGETPLGSFGVPLEGRTLEALLALPYYQTECNENGLKPLTFDAAGSAVSICYDPSGAAQTSIQTPVAGTVSDVRRVWGYPLSFLPRAQEPTGLAEVELDAWFPLFAVQLGDEQNTPLAPESWPILYLYLSSEEDIRNFELPAPDLQAFQNDEKYGYLFAQWHWQQESSSAGETVPSEAAH